MPGDKEHDQAIDESTSSTVVNNDESMAKNDANLNTFYEMHLTDTRESAAAAERTLSQPEGWCPFPLVLTLASNQHDSFYHPT